MTRRKPIFPTVTHAIRSLASDKSALVTHSANKVFVSTARGVGAFTREEWIRCGGPVENGAPEAPTRGDDGGIE